jgi:hypothetical protein
MDEEVSYRAMGYDDSGFLQVTRPEFFEVKDGQGRTKGTTSYMAIDDILPLGSNESFVLRKGGPIDKRGLLLRYRLFRGNVSDFPLGGEALHRAVGVCVSDNYAAIVGSVDTDDIPNYEIVINTEASRALRPALLHFGLLRAFTYGSIPLDGLVASDMELLKKASVIYAYRHYRENVAPEVERPNSMDFLTQFRNMIGI